MDITVRSGRVFQVDTEEPITGSPVRVTVIGIGDSLVDLVVARSFCPSEPDKCGDCEWEDITLLGPDTPWVAVANRVRWLAWVNQLRRAFDLMAEEGVFMETERGISGGPTNNLQVIEELFTYHAPTPEQGEKYVRIREAAKALARVIHEECEAGADRSAAIRKVREAVMTANASIATHNAQYR